MGKALFKKGILIGMILVLFFTGIVYMTSCTEEGTVENYFRRAELSEDAANLIQFAGMREEWIYEYQVTEAKRVSLRAEYYEQGQKISNYGPILNGELKGTGWIIMDYNKGDLMLGISSDEDKKWINTDFSSPDNKGKVYEAREKNLELVPGTHVLAAVVMSKDGRIQSRGVDDEEGIAMTINKNDYVVMFTMEVH